MDKKLEEQMIYPKDLLFAALYRWKAAVALGLILAVLLGGLQLLKGSSGSTADPAAQAVYEEALAEFEEEKALLKVYEEKYINEIAEQTRYIRESVLLNLDPYAHYQGTVRLYVSTGYQIQPDKAYQTPDKIKYLLANYQAFLQSDGIVTALSETAKLQWRLMHELYSVHYDVEAGVLSINIRHSDKAMAERLVEQLLQIAEQYQISLSQTVGEHKLMVLYRDVEMVTDSSLATTAGDARAHLAYLKEELGKIQAEIDGLVPPAQLLPGGASMKKTVIFAMLGFIAGFAVVAVCAWFGHMESDKVYSARLLSIRTGIKVLGTLNVTKFGLLDKVIRKWEGRDMADPAGKAALIACDLRNRFSEGKLLLTGSGSSEEREQLLQALRTAGVEVVDAGNIMEDTQAVEALKQADAVVLTAKCGHATCTGVFRQMQSVSDYQKPLLGCIVLDG